MSNTINPYDDDNTTATAAVKSNASRYAWMMATTAVMGGTLGLTMPFVLSMLRSPLPYMATPRHKVRRALQYIVQQYNQQQRHSFVENQSNVTRRNVPTATVGAASVVHPFDNDATSNDSSRNQLIFLDLGSGDGDPVYQAVRLGFDQAIGLEQNWAMYLISQIRRALFWSTVERRQSAFYNQDAFGKTECTLRLYAQANAIFVFGVPVLMQPLSQTLAQHCRPGTFIMSYRFLLPVKAPPLPPKLLRRDDSYNNTIPQPALDQNKDKHHILQGNHTTTNNESNSMIGLLMAQLVYDVEEMRIYQCCGESQSNGTGQSDLP